MLRKRPKLTPQARDVVSDERRRIVWLRRFEVAAWLLGLLLVAVWGLGRVVGTALERRDLRRFREAELSAPMAPALSSLVLDVRSIDQSQWAEGRIRAYARAVLERAEAPLAVVRIPHIRLEAPVLRGTDEWTLDRGVGWVEGTSRPGESGNVVIAGHRDGFFRGLKDLRVGDDIELATLGGPRNYRIEDIRIVRPEDVQVLDPTPIPTLTLITCYPFFFVGSAPHRYIVRALLVVRESR